MEENSARTFNLSSWKEAMVKAEDKQWDDSVRQRVLLWRAHGLNERLRFLSDAHHQASPASSSGLAHASRAVRSAITVAGLDRSTSGIWNASQWQCGWESGTLE